MGSELNDAGDTIDPGTQSLAGKESAVSGDFNDVSSFGFEIGKQEVAGTDSLSRGHLNDPNDTINVDGGHISG